MEHYIKKLKRRLSRLKDKETKLKNKHGGNESKYTYYGGLELGYVQGKISEIEETIDELEAPPI
tara:strand:+ start:259 stop:450 length:192 start_codon:yes stop_codon:yes gene_type:complete